MTKPRGRGRGGKPKSGRGAKTMQADRTPAPSTDESADSGASADGFPHVHHSPNKFENLVDHPDSDETLVNNTDTDEDFQSLNGETGSLPDLKLDEDDDVCQTCDELICGKPSTNCRKCRQIMCLDCTGIDNETLKEVTNSVNSTMIFCIKCHPSVLEAISDDKEAPVGIVKQLTRKIALLEQRLEEALNLLHGKKPTPPTWTPDRNTNQTTPDMRKIIREEMEAASKDKDVPKNNIAHPQRAPVKDVTTELADRERRKNNIIIHGILEKNSKVGAERLKHDKNRALELLNYCKPDGEEDRVEDDIIQIKRLGKFDENKQESKRPMLVQLTEEDKKTLFLNLNNLRGASNNLSGISISHDMTPLQREEDKEMFEEAKRREEEETSGDFIFRVRGPPWNRYIKKIRKTAGQGNQAAGENQRRQGPTQGDPGHPAQHPQ